MKKLFFLLLFTSIVLASWCDNSFYCDRTYDCRLRVTAPHGSQTYLLKNLNFTNLLEQCETEVSLDKNSLIALHDNSFVPIYFSTEQNQDSINAFFKSTKGPGNYFIYFDPGSGRQKTTYLQEPSLKDITNCSGAIQHPDNSCELHMYGLNSRTKTFYLSEGHPFLKLFFTASAGGIAGKLSVQIKNGEDVWAIPGVVNNLETIYTTHLDPEFPTEIRFAASTIGSVSLHVNDFKEWTFDYVSLDSLIVEEQSKFEIQIPEIFSEKIIIKIKNNGPETLSDVSITSSIGNLSEEYFFFQPFEEKEIVLNISDLKTAAYDVDFNIYFDSNGFQKISKKFLNFNKFISNSITLSNNFTNFNTSYEMITLINNTQSHTFNSNFEICNKTLFDVGETICSEKFLLNDSFFISKFETNDKIQINLKNPFNFSINSFKWVFEELEKAGEVEGINSQKDFSITFSKPNEKENITEHFIYIDQPNSDEDVIEEQTEKESDFEILVFSPKHNEIYDSPTLEAVVDEKVICDIFLDNNMLTSTSEKHILQEIKTNDGNHTLQLNCNNTFSQKNETIYFSVAGKNVGEILPQSQIKTPTALASFNLFPWILGASVFLVFIVIIYTYSHFKTKSHHHIY